MPADPLDHKLAERQLTHLIDSGRLSASEAACLSDGDREARREVMAAVRARHVAERLADAVRLGVTSQAEVEDLAERAREEDQARQVRRVANRVARQARAVARDLA